MKYISAILIVLLMSFAVNAQHSFFGMSYDVSIPMGDTKEYISGAQWRGFGLEGRWYTSKTTSLGFSWDWNVFHDTVLETVNVENRAITGNQSRTINSFPFLLTGHYYLGDKGITPYIGLGVGTYLIKKRLDLGIYGLDDDKWHFGVAPELGIMFPFDLGFNLHVKVRYNYALKAGDAEAQSYLGINIGFASVQLF